MFPRNENRNKGTFAKTTLLRNRPFISNHVERACNLAAQRKIMALFLRLQFASKPRSLCQTPLELACKLSKGHRDQDEVQAGKALQRPANHVSKNNSSEKT